MLTFLLLGRDHWQWFHMLGLHMLCFSLHMHVFPVLWGALLYKVILVYVFWKGKGSVLSATVHQEPVLINNSCILVLLVNFLFTFGACYEILCKASVQYRAFPRDPRKPVLLSSVLVRLKAGTVELFYLWKSSPPFLHTAEATATSYLPCVMTAQLCSGWWKAEFVPSRFYLGWYLSLTI